MAEATLSKDDIYRVITLVRGNMEDGGNYWCYLAVKPSRYDEFRVAALQQYNIQNFASDGYGEVVVSGTGVDPDAEVTEQVAKLFGTTVDKLFSGADPVVEIDRLAAQ